MEAVCGEREIDANSIPRAGGPDSRRESPEAPIAAALAADGRTASAVIGRRALGGASLTNKRLVDYSRRHEGPVDGAAAAGAALDA